MRQGRKQEMLRLGVDIGGTNIKLGIVDDTAMKLVSRLTFHFPGDPEKVCLGIRENAEKLASDAGGSVDDIGAVGIAVPGSVDPAGETVINAFNLGFRNVPLKAGIEKVFPGKKVVMANDADAAALAELKMGAFRGAKTAVLLTLGTGLGGAVIIGGKLFRGGLGHGTEPGHFLLRYGGIPCTCGNSGCAEAYCRAGRLSELYKSAAGRSASPKEVIELALEKDAKALEVMSDYADDLSAVIASFCNILDPEVIALGGGVGEGAVMIYEPLRRLVKEKSFSGYDYKIVPAELGNGAGMLGAALLLGEV